MAGSPRFKVYNPQGEYVASCKHVEDAAMLVGNYGEGAKIRDGMNGKRVVWHEGKESVSASDSYDEVYSVVWERIRDFH
jgi:hypothetical protein